MSNAKTTTKMKSFVKEFIALLEGDNSEVLAKKTLRAADSGLTVHIAGLQGDLIAKEDAVTSAQEKLDKAKVNGGKEIADRDIYVINLLNAKNRLTDAEEALESHKLKLKFLQDIKTELDSEV